MHQKSAIYLLIILLIGCSSPKASYDLLLTNARIVDVENGKIISGQYIAISADTIREVGEMKALSISAAEVLDVRGNYVMPGLWDNHVHFRGGDTLIGENKDLLDLYLAYGITTVRDAGGDITPAVLEWKAQIRKGKLDGPRIFSSGPKLDGAERGWEGSIKITVPEDVPGALDSLEVLGVDYVKMYDYSLTPEAYYEIIREAEKRGLRTTGHMPIDANLRDAIDLGLDGSEHMYYTLKGCSPMEDSLSALGLGYGVFRHIIDTYNEEYAEELFEKMASKGFYVTPTSYIGMILNDLADADHSGDSLLQYMGPGIQKTYQRRIESAKRAKESGGGFFSLVDEKSDQMILPMYKAGVNILAGSDCGPFNSYVYPGEALHGELRQLVKNGLNPREALETSIIHGPMFFGLENYFGTVSRGKVADLIVLNSNPLEDIENTNTMIYLIIHSRIRTPSEFLN